MKPKHTPGPWTAAPFLTPDEDDDPVGVYKVEPAFSQLSDLYETMDPDPESDNYDPDFHKKVHGVNAANARLISAAPDLLDALEWIVEFCNEHPEWTAEHFCNGDSDCAEAAWLEAARSTIAKATK